MWIIPKTKSPRHNMKSKNTTFKVFALGREETFKDLYY